MVNSEQYYVLLVLTDSAILRSFLEICRRTEKLVLRRSSMTCLKLASETETETISAEISTDSICLCLCFWDITQP